MTRSPGGHRLPWRLSTACLGGAVLFIGAVQACTSADSTGSSTTRGQGATSGLGGNGGGASTSSTSSSGQGSSGYACSTPTMPPSAGACVTLGVGVDCNPVTNVPCKASEACDFAPGGFRCYAPPNDVAACGGCDGTNGPHCQGGFTCAPGGSCAKFCCTDADCGASGHCAPLVAGVNAGVCKSGGGSSTSTSSTSTSSTSSSTSTSTSTSTSSSSGAGGAGGAGGAAASSSTGVGGAGGKGGGM